MSETRKVYTAEELSQRAAEERQQSAWCCGDPNTACCSGCARNLTNEDMFRQAAAQARVVEKLAKLADDYERKSASLHRNAVDFPKASEHYSAAAQMAWVASVDINRLLRDEGLR